MTSMKWFVVLVIAACLTGCRAPSTSAPSTSAPSDPSSPAVTTRSAPSTSRPQATSEAPAPVCRVPARPAASWAARACADRSAAAGIRYLERHLVDRRATELSFAQLNALAVIDYLARRWGVAELDGARALAASAPELRDRRNPEVGFWRSGVRPPASVARTLGQLGTLEARFLYCDLVPFGPRVADEVEAGLQTPYGATHLLWWLGWADELGCRLPREISRAAVVDQIVADFEVARTRPDTAPVNDLSIEQGSILAAEGEGRHVPRDWTSKLVAAQLRDGSWSYNVADVTSAEDWHPTMLAVWYLLLVSEPDTSDPGFLSAR